MNRFMKEVLHQMQKERGNVCLSFIVNTHRLSPWREQNREILDKAGEKARALIVNHSEIPQAEKEQLLTVLRQQLDQIDINHLLEGIGIYVSSGFSQTFLFPFHVEEVITIQTSFELRDVLYLKQIREDYLLLVLSKKKIQLFKSAEGEMKEIHNNEFPLIYEEEYEYSVPSVGNSFSSTTKGFERDKSVVQEMRQIDQLKEADHRLNAYLHNGEKLVLSGVLELVADFESITHHTHHIAGRIIGNYSQRLSTLQELAKIQMEEFHQKQIADHIYKLNKSLERQAVTGIRNVWKAVYEGKGLTLLVERNYYQKGYLKKGEEFQLHISPPAGEYQMITDAIDDLIEKQLELKGEVVFVEPGILNEFEKIGLILRYA